MGPWVRKALVALAFCALGCAISPRLKDKSLSRIGETPARELERGYKVHAPDVLEIEVEGRDDLDALVAVAADGRIPLDDGRRARVDGMPVAEIARTVADLLDLQPEQVRVRVAEHRSQVVFVEGEVEGQARAVPYIGPETLPGFLRRAGGLTEAAAPEQVEVRRSNSAEGRAPETIRTDLTEYERHPEAARQIRLMPFDQVSVGTSKQSIVRRCLPPCLGWFWPGSHKANPSAATAENPPSGP